MAKFLDKDGLTHFWGKIKTLLAGKSDNNHNHDGDYADMTTFNALNQSVSSLSNTVAGKVDSSALGTLEANIMIEVNKKANTSAIDDLSLEIQALSNQVSTVYKACGSVSAVSDPAAENYNVGDVYNITQEFTTTASFVEGAGHKYPAGTNIVIVEVSGTRKWDVLAGFIDTTSITPEAITTTEIDTMMSA